MKFEIEQLSVSEQLAAAHQTFVDDATPPPSKPRRPESAAPRDDRQIGESDFGVTPSKLDLVDFAYNNFCDRRDRGENIDPDAFCEQFPAVRSELGRLLKTCSIFIRKPLAFENDIKPPHVPWPQVGTGFGEFQLKLVLGKGAFARVYLATQSKLGNRLVALKVSAKVDKEADVLGRIRHPNIVPVHSVHDDASGLTAVCMPYMGSATLHRVLDRAFLASDPKGSARAIPDKAQVILDAAGELPFPLDPSAHPTEPHPILRNGTYVDGVRLIAAQLAEALAYLHANGICHRDLKPSNVLVSPSGAPLLLDFNLCADARLEQNRLGGTMPYMSPEQLRAMESADAGADLDARSDIFSLGVILYELLTGSHPFGRAPLKLPPPELRRWVLEHQLAPVADARSVNPTIDATFSRLVHRCLELDPQLRPQSAEELSQSLRGSLAPPARALRWIKRHPRVSAGVVVLLAAITIGSVAFAASRPPYNERQIAAGMDHYRAGRYSEAVHRFNDVLHADPGNDSALFARARTFQRLGQFDLATQDYFELDKRSPQGRYKAALGYCANRLEGRPELAIAYYESALESAYVTAEVHNNLAFSYMRMKGKQAHARNQLDRALYLDMNLQAAYHNRAMLNWSLALATKSELDGPKARESACYRLLVAGIVDARKAVELGSPSADHYADAARLCALASKADPEHAAAALKFLDSAITAGMDPQRCIEDPVLRLLENHPQHAELAKRRRENTSPVTPMNRVVDPVRDGI